ncbi:antibiotic biosynthesis monooxygenase family protein [Pilimelia columellifera]|uniref:Antibiotic biosynthesis monooxygenase n=1 Tax=Pilimelia columellifera subsp. columellifera TaxID=706583 RepID=A0ABN3NBH2_9ACTN
MEIARFEIIAGREDEFADGYRRARPLLTESPGCLSARMTRGVETPSQFVLLVEWESIAAHEVGFRSTERFTQWRAIVGQHFAAPPQVEHVADVG